MPLLQTIYFIPSLGQEITDFLLHTVPLRRQRKVVRYLQHVDLWLRHTQYKSLSESLLPLEAYVYFYLSHISVYPEPEPTEPRNYYLPVHINDLLIERNLKGLGRLSNRQAVSRIAATMKWQEHRFGKNLDPLRSQMKKLYRQATRFIHATELTAHTKLCSGESLELICGTCRGVEHWVRDFAMLRLLQETGCTTSDLANAKCTDLLREYNDEWYFRFGTDNKKVRLSEGSATLLQVLLGRHHHLSKYRAYHGQLFSMGDIGVEFEMSAHEVEIVLERRYRFALMLSSANCPSLVNLYDPAATPFPEGFVSERVKPSPHSGQISKVVNLQFMADFDIALECPTSAASEDQYFYEDWDAAIRNSRLALAESKDLHANEKSAEMQNANLREKRVLIAGEGIDETAWADWGVD